MKIWLLVVIVSISVDPGQAGFISPERGNIWQVISDRDRVKNLLLDGARFIDVVYYDPETCQADAEAILAFGSFDQSNSVNAACVEFDIAPPQ